MHICQDRKMHVVYNLASNITQRKPAHSGKSPVCGVVLQPNSDLGVDLALESTQYFFDVYDTLLSTYTESGWCHSGTLGEIEIFKMAAEYLKHILITIISLLMVPETFSPCLVIWLVTQGIWSTMSQRHTTYGHPRWPPLTWKISKWPTPHYLIQFAMHLLSTCRFCPTKNKRVISQW